MIVKKTPEEIGLMRRAGAVVASAHAAIRELVRPGVRTSELDRVAEKVIRSAGCVPSFKGYRGFPASICSSLNDEVVHGIPGKRTLQEGDLLKVDIGAIYQGYHGDSAWSYYVGDDVPEHIEKLMRATEDSLWAGIRQCRTGNRLSDISHAVQQVAEGAGFSVVREYVGHGLGRDLHEDPQIPNYGAPGRGPRLDEGMTLAIEPMVNAGDWRTEVMADGWTVLTADRSLSAHYEHSVAVAADGPLVLTLPDE